MSAQRNYVTGISLCSGVLGLVVHALLFSPGWYSFDSVFQLWQARHWQFNSLSPVAPTLLLSTLQQITGARTSLPIFYMHLAMFWTGIAVLFVALNLRWRSAIVAFLIFAIVSPLWWTIAHVWTDSAMLASFTLAASLLLAASRTKSMWLHSLVLLPLFYGSFVRYNAMPAAIPLVIWWWRVAPWRATTDLAPSSLRRFRAAIVAICLGAIFAAASIGATRALNAAFASEQVRTWPVQVLHDLVGISLATQRWYVPEFARPAALTFDTLRPAYTPYVAVPILLTTPALRSGLSSDAFSDEEAKQLAMAWWAAIRAEPGAYLKHRAAMMKRLWVAPNSEFSYASPGASIAYRDNPPLNDFTTTRAMFVSTANAWAWRIHFSALPYLVIAIALFAAVTTRAIFNVEKRCTPSETAISALLASAFIHALGLAVFAPCADTRFVSWPIAAIIIAALIWVAEKSRFKAKAEPV